MAEEGTLPTFSFNVVDEPPGGPAKGEPMPSPVMHHIIGGCEVILPKPDLAWSVPLLLLQTEPEPSRTLLLFW